MTSETVRRLTELRDDMLSRVSGLYRVHAIAARQVEGWAHDLDSLLRQIREEPQKGVMPSEYEHLHLRPTAKDDGDSAVPGASAEAGVKD